MKMNLYLKTGCDLARKVKGFGLITTVVFAGTALGAMAYHHIDSNLALAARDASLNERMAQVARDYGLLHQLEDSERADEVRQMLSFELAGTLRELLSDNHADATPEQRWVNSLCSRILLEEKRHPQYFVTATNEVGVQQQRSWAALQHQLYAATAVPVPQSKSALPLAAQK